MESTKQLPQKFAWRAKEKKILVGLSLLGLICFGIGLASDPQRAWANYLQEYYYWLCLALAGVFFTALQHLAGATWSVTVRRIAEAFSGFLPVAFLLFIGLLFGLHHLYEWTHAHVMHEDPLLAQKIAYLNVPFFVVRSVIVFVAVFLLGGWMIKNSILQDQSGDLHLSAKNVRLAAPFMLIFAWSFTFMSVDLIMSLSPHWFSTIFGIYCFAGLFYSGLAMITLCAIFLKRRGSLGSYFTVDHLHDLGKLMFAFLVFWTYIAFSQYMLIWYANLPEETSYMIPRTTGAWQPIFIALILGKFAIPFFMTVSRFSKRNEKWMLLVALWFLAAQWLDIYWMVFPTYYPAPVFGWMEVGMFIGFGSLFLLAVGRFLERVSPVAIRDPGLEKALHHHQ